MKTVLILILITSTHLVLASDSPFPGVTGVSFKNSGAPHTKCSATYLLRDVLGRASLNIVDENTFVSWTCKRDKPIPYDSTDCPYPQHMKTDELSCYSHSRIENRFGSPTVHYPIVCVGEPRVVSYEKLYADTGLKTWHRPRFKSLWILQKSPTGDVDHINIHMDEDGCEPVSRHHL